MMQSDNYLVQMEAAVEMGRQLVLWQHVTMFFMRYLHGWEVLQIGDGYSFIEPST